MKHYTLYSNGVSTRNYINTMENGVVYDTNRYKLFGNMLINVLYVVCLHCRYVCVFFSCCVLCIVEYKKGFTIET